MRNSSPPTRDEPSVEARIFDILYSEADRLHGETGYIVPERLVREITQPLKQMAGLLTPREFASTLMGDLRGKILLDYGAGDGWNSVCFAKAGAKVWAIDISSRGIELTRKKAQANGVAALVTAEVRDCYNTGFEQGFFDIIYGNGILHHLDLEAAGREIARICRPEGVAVFSEPIRENHVLDAIKSVIIKMTGRKPSQTTPTESPLTLERIQPLRRYFGIVRCRWFEVLSSMLRLLSVPPALSRWRALERCLLGADYVLMSLIPGFKRLGRLVVIELRQPRHS